VTDLRYEQVKNKVLLVFGGFAILLNVIFLIWTKDVNYKSYFIQVIAAVLISLFLYFYKIWAGGDCKLYIVIALSLPCNIVTQKIYGISLLIFIPFLSFGIGYIYIIIDSIVQRIKTKKKNENILSNTIKAFVRYLSYYLLVVFVSSIVLKICELVRINTRLETIVTVICIVVVLLVSHFDVMKYKSVVLTLLIVDVVLGVVNTELLLSSQTILLLIAIIITNFFRIFSNNYNYEEIGIGELKEGMILSAVSSVLLANDRRGKFKKISDESLSSRLTGEDISYIKELSDRNRKLTSVTIVRKIPFALFIAVSVICVIMGELIK
jgi:preflagellin peptidase FlaK